MTQDYGEALKWYLQAAQTKPTPALLTSTICYAELKIGSFYENGYGVPSSGQMALDWYYKALHHGCMEAAAEIRRVAD